MWTCAHCNERVESTFAICWNCGTDQEGNLDPDFHREPGDTRHSDDVEGQASGNPNPYAPPAIMSDEVADPDRTHRNLRSIRRAALFLCVASTLAAAFCFVQFSVRAAILAKEAPELLGTFWPVFDFLHWRLLLGGILVVNAHALWRQDCAIRRVIRGQAASFDALLSSQKWAWTIIATSVAIYVTKETVLLLMTT